MCRFVAYLGKKPVILNEVLDKPENSLINQSRKTRGGNPGLNADGFGIGWYDHAIDNKPGVFKSIQPAWNDHNLRHIASKIRSKCFMGHVRASTVGDVNTFNCHPFAYEDFLFVHNGTIRDFEKIKRKTLGQLSDEKFELIKGETDSEHFFALVMDILYQEKKTFQLSDIAQAVREAISQITTLQKTLPGDPFSRINIAITDGKQMIVTRYVSSTDQEALSLHYALGDYIDTDSAETVMHDTSQKPGAVIIASEPLTDYTNEWREVPANHMLLIDEQLNVSLESINI
jgi:glutamine amidotransferase